MLINDVLKLLTKQSKSISVVIDEYGGISGILTVEDIVEELLENEDEYDKVDHIENKIDKNNYNFSARLEVDYINKKYNLSLPESEFYETIGGLIAYNTGEIPRKGEKIEINQYVFTVTKVTSKKIEEINLTLKEE